MIETRALSVVKQSDDPVIARKRRKLELIEEMARRFKRIDIKFLAIPERVSRDKPAFAILPLNAYIAGATCTYGGYTSGYSWPVAGGMDSHNFVEVLKRQTDLLTSASASPSSAPTDEALAVAEEVGGKFDRIMVAWEADWSESAADPLMIGEIDGIWFLLAKWDMTNLESYVASFG